MPVYYLTLDHAQDKFRHEPNLMSARAYQRAVLEYAHDEMISVEEFRSISVEIADWLINR